MLDLKRTTEIDLQIATEAAELARGYFGQARVEHKGDGSLVTQADREAEKLLRRRLAEFFPEHAVFGEEFGLDGPADSPYVWYLDPVDGTSNFVYGLPLWGVSVGLTYEERSLAGALVMPALDDRYWAWEGGGAYRNGRRVQALAPRERRANDLISVYSADGSLYRYDYGRKHRCLGSAAHALAGVAAGHFVAALQDNWHCHDFAAVMVMCREAGADIVDLEGRPFTSFAGMDRDAVGPPLLAAAPPVVEDVLHILRG